MPYHIEIDGYTESTATKGKIGTTKRGIGPTYTDKMARIALKIQDLFQGTFPTILICRSAPLTSPPSKHTLYSSLYI